jgi:fumarylacetoacetate (FAA) hydrolase family protein
MSSNSTSTVTSFDDVSVIPPQGTFVGRCWVPSRFADDGIAGPRVVTVREGHVVDLSGRFATFSDLLNDIDPLASVRAWAGVVLGSVDAIVRQSRFDRRASSLEGESNVVLLAPNDIAAVKACGVTFIRSLLERVVEEKARGNPQEALRVRAMIHDTLGDDLSRVKPGSPATVELKSRLIEAGMWSQYLEVGIGPDPEVFTKAQPMASVGYGAEVGVLPESKWNNPEPEIVLAVSSRGDIVGVTMGNDVNLRDIEGRSALLLGEAKDQNGSCAIGPMVRLFDDAFTLDDVARADVELTVVGADGYRTSGVNSIRQISRSPRELASHVCGEHHQYPDGFMLFLGTMFAPTETRGTQGQGFTHHTGDRVEIASPTLGRLVNWVNATNAIPKWTFGISSLMQHLLERRRVAAKTDAD